jgi:SET domain-containing protein
MLYSRLMKRTSTKKTDERFVVRKSGPGKGHGLFALKPVKKGEFILEYVGKKIPTSLADTLATRYLFEIDGEWTIDGSERSNAARYINHSCDPNCEVYIEKGRIMIYAIKNIAAGEELTYDYGDEYFDEFLRPVGCRCGSMKCRKPAKNE